MFPHRGRTLRPGSLGAAFSLVELLVVIAIIALLISIAVPGYSRVRKAAKVAATQSTIHAIDVGLESFQTEQKLGNAYPPSASDGPSGSGYQGMIADPLETPTLKAYITGASLLVYALAGPDNQGTAGFRDADNTGFWADDLRRTNGGLYDPGVTAPAPRYGPYGPGKLLDREKRLSELPGYTGNGAEWTTGQTAIQPVFTDDFKSPILYYRARKSAQKMITKPGEWLGIYDHRDNSLITGGIRPGADSDPAAGICPAPGKSHPLGITRYPPESGSCVVEGNFDTYVLDKKASRYNTGGGIVEAKPVRAQEYLLISAGPDLLFGTKDDVTNWSR